jgi:hypothetical protein
MGGGGREREREHIPLSFPSFIKIHVQTKKKQTLVHIFETIEK